MDQLSRLHVTRLLHDSHKQSRLARCSHAPTPKRRRQSLSPSKPRCEMLLRLIVRRLCAPRNHAPLQPILLRARHAQSSTRVRSRPFPFRLSRRNRTSLKGTMNRARTLPRATQCRINPFILAYHLRNQVHLVDRDHFPRLTFHSL